MKDMKTKEQFIELRAHGYSFDRIAKEINVSKPTRIKWHKEFEREIGNLRFSIYEALLEKYDLIKRKKVESMAKLLQRAQQELGNRDLADLSVKQLIELIENLQIRLFRELESVGFKTGELDDPFSDDILATMGERTISLLS